MTNTYQIKYQEQKLDDNLVLISLKGNILSKEATEHLVSFVEEKLKTSTNFIFDMKKVSQLNSAGLNVLISLFTKIRNKGGDLAIIHLSESVEKLIIITKLNSIFNIFDSLQQAKDYFHKTTLQDS